MSTFLLNKKYLPHRVGVCFIIGIIAGLFFHDFSIWVKPAGDLFMNMIKMLIVPVIFFSVTSGIAAIGDVQRLKRIGSKVVIVYFLMTVIACIVGIVMVNITHPGVGFTLDNMQAFDTSKVKTPSFVNFLFDMVPVNIVDSMAKNQIMQMIFFTVLVGVALVSLGEKVAGVTKIFDQCASIIYKMLDIVMLYSPIGVLALMANTTAVFGPKLFGVLAKFVFTDWVGCLLIWFFFSGIVWLYTKVNYLEMCKSMIPIWVNTIATNSSAGTIPITLNVTTERLKVPMSIASFSIPLGATINLTGAALYKTILAFFVAEIYGLQLTIVDNFSKYTAGNGIIELRRLISKKLHEDNNLEYTTDEICATVGAKQAIFNSIMALVDPGDEVLLPVPCWVSYTEMIKFAGAKPVFVDVEAETFDLDIEALEKAVTTKTKAIVICTPNNPTGAVYSEGTLRKLADLACKYDFYIITDEIYEKLIYDDAKHFSIASISKDVWNRTLTVNGFSKAYAMTGWRIGYVAANKTIIDAIKKIQSQTTSATSAISQKAAVAALSGPQHDLEVMVAEFDKRRIYLLQRLAEMPGVSCAKPRGAFYLLPDFSCYFGKKYRGREIKDAVDFANILLEAVLVALVPGEAFNIKGKVRLSYSNSMENLKEAMDRIQTFVRELE